MLVAEDKVASIADVLLRIQNARALEDAVRIATEELRVIARAAAIPAAIPAEQHAETEAKLREVFLSLLQNAPFITYIKDIEGRYLFYNREAERVLRMGSKQYFGKTIRDIFDSTFAAAIEDMDRKVVATSSSRAAGTRRASGSRWMRTTTRRAATRIW